jgi:hypothetical protein
LLSLLRDSGGQGVKSLIDIGCGREVWLAEFQRNGVLDVAGRDGHWTDTDRLLADRAQFKPVNLGLPLADDLLYDCAMCLEVAEHLEHSQASQFVANLVSLSNTVVFSAAIRGQGGQFHINEQDLSYWAGLFAACGYHLFDVVRPRVWTNSDICWWYRQNIVIFACETSPYWAALTAARSDAPPIVNLAHPDGFEQKARLANLFSPEEYFGKLLGRINAKHPKWW